MSDLGQDDGAAAGLDAHGGQPRAARCPSDGQAVVVL